ncbi:hypothetical protein WJS89_05640 [Sphingomicrobium sp. XHP0235]|uniref:hypothetical protein n=1 Tax=Sphingomicrobium aquimarinum TaxID=3133971 RepID=UPI0031FE7F56
MSKSKDEKLKHQPHNQTNVEIVSLPQPRGATMRLMHALATLIDGGSNEKPVRCHPSIKHVIILQQAGLGIVGTDWCRPLLIAEACSLSQSLSTDVIVARSGDAISKMSFDVHFCGHSRTFTDYRLWKDHPEQAPWLIPSAGPGKCVRLTANGLELANEAPFDDEIGRWRGITLGNEYLSTVIKGWI